MNFFSPWVLLQFIVSCSSEYSNLFMTQKICSLADDPPFFFIQVICKTTRMRIEHSPAINKQHNPFWNCALIHLMLNRLYQIKHYILNSHTGYHKNKIIYKHNTDIKSKKKSYEFDILKEKITIPWFKNKWKKSTIHCLIKLWLGLSITDEC